MTANTKNRRRTLQLGTALATCLAYAGGAQVAGAQDIPTNPVIISGGLTAGDITTVPNTSVNVDLKGANAVVHWNTFNLNNASNSFNVVSTVPDGSGGTMADATARTMVNQVVGTLNADGGQTISASLINGVINASNPGGAPINFWLINPAGITFGATGTFSGNSLVLSTLPTGFNFAAAGANPYGTAVSFSPATVGPNDVLPAAADRTINLSAGSKLGTAASPLAGGVLVVAQEITAGGEIHAAGKVGLVAASDVSFPSGVGSPLSFVITTGTTLKGVHVLGSADINGAAVVVGAVSKTTALDNLLQVDNAKLTATSGTDGITLTTTSRATNGDGIAVASGASLTTGAGTGAPVEIIADGALSFDGNIASNGAASLVSLNTSTTNSVAADNANLDVGASANITSVGNLTIMAAGTGGKAVSLQHNSASGSTGLKATGATGNVLIDAGTLDLVQAADVASASDYTVNAKSVILGNGATPVTQSAVGKVRITTTSAAGITGEQGLTLRSNATNEDSGNMLILDANDDGSGGPFGVINFAQGSLISAGDSSDVTKNAAIGLRFDRTPLDPLDPTDTVPQLTLGSARGYQIGDFDGTDINVPLTGEGAFTAQFITTDNPFLAAFKDAISITGSVKTAGSDIRLSAGKDLLVANAATTLAGDPVATPPTAGSIMLQAGGKITSNGALIAGEDVLARSIGVAQLGTVRAGDDIAVSATAAITVTNAITRAAINGTGDASFDDAQAGTAAGITPTSLAPADRSNILLSSAGDVTLTNASAGATGAFGSIALLSGGAVRSSGTLTAREDVQVRSVGLTDLNAVTAGDDIVVWSGGTLDLVDGQTTGAGSDARNVTFNTANAGKPGSITFAALDPYGASNILLSAATDLTITDATIGGAGASGTIALLSGGTTDSTGTLTALEDVQVRSGGAATLGTLKAGDDIYVHSDSTIDLTSAETTGSGSNGRTVNFAAPASAGQVGSISFVAPDNNAALTPGANIVLEGTGLGGTAPTEIGLSLGNTDTASPFVTGEAQLIADTGDIRIGTLSADTSDIFVQAQQGSITGLAVSGFTPTTGMTLTSAGNVVLNTGYATVGSITANSGSVTSNGSATAIRIGRVDAASVDLSTTSLLRIDAGDVAGLTRLHTTGGAPNATFVPGLDTLAPAFSDANLSVTGAGSTITVDGANALLLDGVHAPVVKLGAVSANVAPLLGNQVFVDGYDVSVGSVRAQGDIRVQSNTDLLTGNFGEDAPVVAGDTPGLFSSANGDVTLVASAGSVHGRSRAAQTFGTGFGAIHADGDLSVDTATPGYGDFRVNSLTAGGDISLDIAGSLYGYGNAPSVSGAKLQALNGAVSVTAGDTINLKEIESPFPISLDAQHVGIETVTLNSAAPTIFFFSTSGFAAPNVYVGQLRSNRNLRVTGDFGPRAIATAAGLVTPTLTFAALGTNKTTLSADGTISGSVGDAAQIDTATAGIDIDLTTGALTASRLTATNGQQIVTAQTGTLAVDTAEAKLVVELIKQQGSVDTFGDELRAGIVTAGTVPVLGPAVILDSFTHVRTNSVTATNSDISVTARNGDVSGFYTNAPTPPTLLRLDADNITQNDAFSNEYLKADLTAQARNGSITVTALNGAVQLGAVNQATALPALATDRGNITVDALGISADTVTARTGTATAGTSNVSLTARAGTLVVGDVTAVDTVSLVKQGNAATAGNTLRFTSVKGGQGETDPTVLATDSLNNPVVPPIRLGVVIDSATSVFGDTAQASLGGVRVDARDGQVGGRTGGTSRLAIDATGGATAQDILVRSRGAVLLSTVDATNDVSIIAGAYAGSGLVSGTIDLNSATSQHGSVHLTAVSDTASRADITFGSLTADLGSLYLMSSGTQPGTIKGNGLARGRDEILMDGRVIDLDTARATAGDILLLARAPVLSSLDSTVTANLLDAARDVGVIADGDIGIGTVFAGRNAALSSATNIDVGRIDSAAGSIFGRANRSITIRHAFANGDIALEAGLAITIGDDADPIDFSAQAGDDITLLGSTVMLTKAVSTGLTSVNDPAPGGLLPVRSFQDPLDHGVIGHAPSVTSALGSADTPGHNIGITATSGDVAGLAKTVSPVMNIYSTDASAPGNKLSNDFGAAVLTAQAKDGSITVSAANGSAQLGTVVQGTSASGTGSGSINVSARAVGVDTVTANTGAVTLTATQGTLVAGDVSAFDKASLLKTGTATNAGNDVRFTSVKGGQGETDLTKLVDVPGEALGVSIDSATDVLGNTVLASLGGARVIARLGTVDGRTAIVPAPSAVMNITATGAPDTAQNITVRSATAIDLGTVTARDDVSIIGGATAARSGLKTGGIAVVDTTAQNGSVYLTAVNEDLASTSGDIRFHTIAAPNGSISLITSGSARGSVAFRPGGAVPFAIDARDDVGIDAVSLDLQSVRARSGSIALNAADGISAGELKAGRSIAGIAGGAVTVLTATADTGDIALSAGDALRVDQSTAADDVIYSGRSVQLVNVTARGAGDIGDPDLATLVSIKDPAPDGVAGSVPTASGSLDRMTGGNIVVTATGGDIGVSDFATAQASALFGATGAVTIKTGTASGGSFDINAGGDVSSADSLSAADDLAIQSGGAITLGTASGASFTATAGTSFQANGAISAGNTTLGSDGTATTVAITAKNGALSATTIDVAGAGHDATLTATGGITLDRVTAARSITANGGTLLSANTLTATSGALTGTAGTIGVGGSNSGSATSYSSSANTTVTTLKAGTTATVTAGGAVSLSSLESGADAKVTAGTDVGLGTFKAGGAADVVARAGDVTATGAFASGGATRITAGIDGAGSTRTLTPDRKVTLAAVTSAGDATVTATGIVTLNGAFTATGKKVTITAKDAEIGADVSASAITVVDEAPSTNKLVVGGSNNSGGFALTNTEIDHLKATDTLVLDAASGTTKQDVAIAVVDFKNTRDVQILANGTRIDVTGRITQTDPGPTSSTTPLHLQLGGSGASTGRASVIVVSTNPTGTAGGILATASTVELRADNIAFGQEANFLSTLGVTGTGTGNAAQALDLNDRGSSTLYVAGALDPSQQYTLGTPPVSLLSAKSLTLAYTNFALFQNTGLQGQTSGVDIADTLTLDLASATRPVLGLFGTLATRTGTAAALLLGVNIKVINLNDRSSARVNGCIIGEASGCISTLAFSPNLSAIDAVRPGVFTVSKDFEVPFNPLLATNNDALFGDVGTFGLETVPLQPIECSDPKNPQCPVQKKDAK